MKTDFFFPKRAAIAMQALGKMTIDDGMMQSQIHNRGPTPTTYPISFFSYQH